MTPQTVNAYYNPTHERDRLPGRDPAAAVLQLKADDAVNYGGIGAVIGHEIGHGFDDQGSKWDGAGNLNQWWTPADRAEFDKRGDALAAQYDQFEPFPGYKVNGRLTLGENIGRPGRADDRLRGLSPLARRQAGAGDRRPDRRSAVLHRLGAGLAARSTATPT